MYIYMYIFAEQMFAEHASAKHTYIYMVDIYICGGYIFANLIMALWYIHTVLRMYLPYGTAHTQEG